MVPKLFASGKSFAKLAAYILHDADKAATSDRVPWTHTLNLASDDSGLAVHEMLWTYRAAEDLKRQAGVRNGGRQLENPTRHLSLNWHPSEMPSRAHMIEAVESFLAHMKWQDHQVLIVCHDDKHPHVHAMINSVHPETGRALDTSFEKRRAQEWALTYERDHQLIFCEERLKSLEQRTPSPTRETWMKLRTYEREDDKAELQRVEQQRSYFHRHDGASHDAQEWKALKSYQRDQREAFFLGGKQAYREARNTAYREIRKELRGEWHKLYQAKAAGMDKLQLAAMKAALINRQNETLDARRQHACAVLREQRDENYSTLLAQQQEQRDDLRDRQHQGLPSYRLFDGIYPVDRDATAGQQRGPQPLLRQREQPGFAQGHDVRDQFEAAFRSATQVANETRQQDEARQKSWRPHVERVPQPRASDDPSWERQAAALRSAGEGTKKLGEFENAVRRAWTRARPTRDRGRD